MNQVIIQVADQTVINQTGKQISKQSMRIIEGTVKEFDIEEYMGWNLVKVSDVPHYERAYLITNTTFLIQDFK